ncbi:hypothetical protein JTE90_010752 [Oedothorax gibbosus]|uniref:Uncharacterized protein n=1 Tax=Oedothorax gibbosus TaxID=931172 RepID=A0AAV6UDW0_9ARAC|nr:hypothetical protein JTE90_010752 [Oedothorax gibbosus]
MEGIKSPMRSPARSPALSPARSPALSPNRSPNKSPNISPGRSPGQSSPNYGSPPLARHRSASIPVTPEALKGVRNRFLNAPGGLYPLGENHDSTNLLKVEADSRGRLPRSAPELTVDEASSPGSISPWNDDPREYSHSLAYTVHRPQAEVLSRRFSETLTVSNEASYKRRRRKSLSPHHSRSLSFRALKKTNQWDEFRPRGRSVPCVDPIPTSRSRRASHQYAARRDRSVSPRPSLPLEMDDDKYYMLRQFCITSKGDVVNKGDLYRERSRSNNSVASTGSNATVGTGGGVSSATSLSSGNPSNVPPKKVVMMGTVGVGKTSLVTQFMSSEYMNYDGSLATFA